MKVAENYLKIIENWDRTACEQHIADSWTDDSSMAITGYLRECVKNEYSPTFKGFILYLCSFAPVE